MEGSSRQPGKQCLEPDAEYCQFFRVSFPFSQGTPLDRLSCLACDRQGVVPEQLLPREAVLQLTETSTDTVSGTPSPSQSQRRRALLKIVETERRGMVGVLSSVVGEHLTATQRALQTELRAQHTSSRSNVPEESEWVRRLLCHSLNLAPGRERLQHTIAAMRRQGHERIEKMRRQQLRVIAGDLEREVERQSIVQTLEEKAAALAEQKQRRADELRRQVEEEEAKIREKQRERERRAAAEALRKQQVYEERRAKEETQIRRARKRTEMKLEQMKERSHQQEEKAHQLLDRVRGHEKQVQKERARAYLDSVEAHGDRSDTLTLQQEVQREQRRVGALRRLVAARHFVETSGDGSSEAREHLVQHHNAARNLLKQQKAAQQKRFKERQSIRSRRIEQAMSLRREEDKLREQRAAQIVEAEDQKALHLASLRDAQANQRAAKLLLEAQRQENHDENLARSRRQHGHKLQIKADVVAERDEQERAKQAMRVHMAKKMQLARLSAQKEQDDMQQEIQQLQNDPSFKSGEASTVLSRLKGQLSSPTLPPTGSE